MKSILKNLFRVGLLVALMAPAAQLLSASNDCSCCQGCGSCGCCDDCFSCCNDCSDCCCCTGHTYWTQREQDAQYWLTMAMSADKQHKSFDNDEWYNVASLNAGYERSFGRHRISSYFFNKNGSLNIGPDSLYTGKENTYDVRSSDLGLPAKLVGKACLDPRISNVYVNFDWYTEWNQWAKGLNTWINIPFVHTQWNIRPSAKTITDDTGVVGHTGYYYTPYIIGPDGHVPADQYTHVLNTSATPVSFVYKGDDAVGDALRGDESFGDVPALKAGKIKCCNATASGLSGIRFGIGYDFVRKERGNIGLGLDVVAPAANKPAKNLCCCTNNSSSSCCGCGSNSGSCGSCCDNNLYYFMPSIGGQHAWKVGGLLRGQYIVWDKADDHNITMYLDGRAYGVIKARSTRLLGLKVGDQTQFNHWLVLKKYNVSGDVATYAGMERAANLLSACVTNTTGVEGQATIMFTYKKGGFTGELGYNFFGRRAECAKCWTLCNDDATNDTYRYVIKAEAPVLGTSTTYPQGGFFDKTKTDINTTPGTGSGVAAIATVVVGSQNLTTALTSTLVKSSALDFSNGNCSCNGDIDTSVAMHPSYFAHTIFGSLGYTWVDTDWTPSLGVVGKVELGHKNTSLRTWGVFVEGGLTF